MGLDMYLTKRVYVKNWDYMSKNEKHQITVKGPRASRVDPKEISCIIMEVGYWRKANQIHNWFVENVQGGVDDCKEYYVECSQLEELLNTCKKVLENTKLVKGKVTNGWHIKDGKEEPILEDGELIEDSSVAEELLPAASGFFFGSTEYDQYYIDDIKHTIEILQKALANDTGDSFYYHSSW